MSDNRPWLSGHEFKQFAIKTTFQHITASPHYLQSNGLVENGIKIINHLLKKTLKSNSDPFLALLNYRLPAVKHGLSLADILFKRKVKIRTSALEINVRAAGDLQIYKKTNKAKQHNSSLGPQELP